jgi:hypothetical protein
MMEQMAAQCPCKEMILDAFKTPFKTSSREKRHPQKYETIPRQFADRRKPRQRGLKYPRTISPDLNLHTNCMSGLVMVTRLAWAAAKKTSSKMETR